MLATASPDSFTVTAKLVSLPHNNAMQLTALRAAADRHRYAKLE
jgi:hypothetical protein